MSGVSLHEESLADSTKTESEVMERAENIVTRYFQESRHTEEIVGMSEDDDEKNVWRKYGKERMKTVSVALILCLHLGVDPPDKDKRPDPCARMEAWIDPAAGQNNKATAKIAAALQKNYERWQPRARTFRYKVAPDPTVEEVRRICVGMRRNARDERVLFHYNGHGVPRPTVNGEIWVFNKNFTQYIPLSVYDLQGWMETPSIYVWDCDAAEIILNSFNRFANDHETEWTKELDDFQEKQDGLPPLLSNMGLDEQAETLNFPKKRPRFKDCIQLASCKVDQKLPTHPSLPADLFTSCLTTPIHMSVLWHLIRHEKVHLFENLIDEIPGVLNDRRTLLGELNWIFTAITDTMAWNALPRDVFQRLFRQDLLLASLFRSFLLAERIMGAYGCDVVSVPRLPSTAEHPLWESWDYTIDLCVSHLLSQKAGGDTIICPLGRDFFSKSRLMPLNMLIDMSSLIKTDVVLDSQYNSFFVEQLRAFEVWLEYGVEKKRPPQQLPVVLQVLLSQVHRVRALELLARFLDHGQWAVGYALSVGIFPYVLKLLQSNTRELKPSLAFIWAKILAVDPGCQAELFKENGEESRADSMNAARPREKKELRYFYFVKMLNDNLTPPRQKVVPAFVLATLFHNNYRTAQEILTEQGYVNLCTELLVDPIASSSRLFKLWILIGLGRLWADYNTARWQAVRLVAYAKVEAELEDDSPEVRAAAVYALGCLVKNRADTSEHALVMSQQLCDSLCSKCTRDGAHIVREELLVALQYFVCDSSSSLANLHCRLREQCRSIPSRVEEEEEETIERDSILVETAVSEERGVGSAALEKSWMSARSERLSSARKRNDASESSVAIDELVAALPPADYSFRQQYAFNSEDVACREECIKMLHILESKNFVDPTERIFLSVLRLVLDPIERVSRMARVLVRYIAQLSERKEQFHREIKANVSSVDLLAAAKAAAKAAEAAAAAAARSGGRRRNNAGDGSSSAVGIFDMTGIEMDAEGNEIYPTGVEGTEEVDGDDATAAHSPAENNGNDERPMGLFGTLPPPEPATSAASAASELQPPSGLFNTLLSPPSAPPSAPPPPAPAPSPASAPPPKAFNAHHQRAKDDLDLPAGGVTFTVGSPQPINADLSTTPIENVGAFRMRAEPAASSSNLLSTPLGPRRKLSAPPLTSTPKVPVLSTPGGSSSSARRNPEDYPFMNLNTLEFQPKRRIAEKREIGNRARKDNREEINKPWEDLVETKFVPWCARVFTEPILDLIQSEDADCASEGVLTQANATDWAIHYEEGLRQQGSDEFRMIRERPELMGEQRWLHKREGAGRSSWSGRKFTSLVFSLLRPYVYCTDGDSIEMLQYDSGQMAGLPTQLSSSSSSATTTTTAGARMTLVNSFPVHAGNAFSVEKTRWLEVINATSTEMLLSGSSEGVVKVWDVHLNVHSHEMEKETSLISAAFPLSDQPRMVEKGVRGPTTVYEWDQTSGGLLCAGNVKVCRVWDAHTEKPRLDIPTGRRAACVSIAAELDYAHLIALGFRDGAVHVHDTRMPTCESRILQLYTHKRPIVGVSVRSEGETRCLLSAASSDGLLCVWEPRMYKEPVVDVNILDDSLTSTTSPLSTSHSSSSPRPFSSSSASSSSAAHKSARSSQHRFDPFLLPLSSSSSSPPSLLSMRMHSSAQILSCSLSSASVRVYDISGRMVAPLRPWGAGPLITPSLTAFHPRRALLAVAHSTTAGDACVSIFGPPEKTARGTREEKRDRLGRR